jgi:hypothetical protein
MIITDVPKNIQKVPDVSALARKMTTQSQIGIILDLVKKVPPGKFFFLGIRNMPSFFQLLKKDFGTGVVLLTELEILTSSHPNASYVLHNQMTDMALALRNKGLLQKYFQLAESYSFEPWVATYNPEKLIQFLSSFRKLPKSLTILTPRTSTSLEELAKNSQLRICFL